MAKYPGLRRQSNGIWQYRVRIPKDILDKFDGKKEFKRSLGTKSKSEAIKEYHEVAKQFALLFDQERSGEKPEKSSSKILTKQLAELLAQQYFSSLNGKLLQTDTGVFVLSEAEAEAEVEDAKREALIEVSIYEHPETGECWQSVSNAGSKVLESIGIALDVQDQHHMRFLELIRRGLLEVARREVDRSNNDFSNRWYDELFAGVGSEKVNIAAQDQQLVTFGELCDRYWKDFETSASVKAKSLNKKRASLKLLEMIVVSSRDIKSIDRALCREVRNTLAKLPSNMNKKNKGFTIEQHIAVAEKQELPILSYDTQKTYLNTLKAVVNWGAAEGLMTKVDVADLVPVGKQVASKEKRNPFTDDQLQTIFHQPLYVGCKDDEKGYAKQGPNVIRRGRFWIPLIGLFSGMRLSEICQLRKADVERSEGGVRYFNVTDAGENSVKTASALRFVPVHPELLKIAEWHELGEKVVEAIVNEELEALT